MNDKNPSENFSLIRTQASKKAFLLYLYIEETLNLLVPHSVFADRDAAVHLFPGKWEFMSESIDHMVLKKEDFQFSTLIVDCENKNLTELHLIDIEFHDGYILDYQDGEIEISKDIYDESKNFAAKYFMATNQQFVLEMVSLCERYYRQGVKDSINDNVGETLFVIDDAEHLI